jgi:hypothetical protein
MIGTEKIKALLIGLDGRFLDRFAFLADNNEFLVCDFLHKGPLPPNPFIINILSNIFRKVKE